MAKYAESLLLHALFFTLHSTSITNPILAIDLGKYKSVACVFGANPSRATFASLTTDREHLRKRIGRTKPSVVLIEASLLAGWMHDLCEEMHAKCEVANTARSRIGS